jgi:hypothetical protein
MKRLWFALGALAIFFFGNLGIAPNLDIRVRASSPPDVCDCRTICKMHLRCDVPKCNGRIAQESEDQDDTDSPGDDVNEILQQET